ncbi:MAG: DNA translocase FtsK, partial [Clostridia bacterium]|nr:DNA translocase FtsK [Clostridia bacterium]
RPARAANQPVRKRAATPAPAPEERKGAAKSAASQPAPRKRKKLYIENVEKAPEQAPQKDELFDIDDFDRLEAESAAFDKAERSEKRARKSFQPDRPSMLREGSAEILDIPDAPPEEIPPEETPAEVPVVKADKKSNVSIDDLKIQPEAYEVPDEDEAPFDVPKVSGSQKVEAGIAEKKSFSKLKRVKEPEPVEDEPPVYNYPPIDLLARGEVEDTSIHNQKDLQKAQLLEETLQSFGISAKLTGIAHGPAVTRFELQPAPGVKVSRITSLADDIALNLAAMSVRIEAPIPGKAAVGVEIPNDKVEMVRLRDVLESSDARKHPSRIAVGLGKDNSGRYIVADIAKMPHVLIAGQTGSGKSVCINAIIASILFRSSPEEVKLILIDPKVVELSIYNDIPHLVCPVVTDPKKAASALDWAVAEMTKRYKLFAERGVRDIKGYNKALKPGERLMPQMVIIIDELADLMMVSPGEVEDSICRLAQLARACGMHLVIATQRPSVNVITGIIKANIPTRIAFSVASQVDSRTMIDHGGAEKLLGNGDMLFVPNGMKSMRVQGAWVSDDEVHAIVEYIKQSGEANYDPDMLEHMENAVRSDAEKEEVAAEYDPRLPEAIDIVIDMGQASISMLQRRMRIGYAKAGRLIDEMAQRGIVSEADGAKPRQVLITREEAQAMFED